MTAPLRAIACFKSAKKGRCDAWLEWWLKVRKRDAETRRTQRTQGLRGGFCDNTTACRCLVLLLLSQRQLPSASVFDPKEGKDSELLHVVSRRAKKRTLDARRLNDVRRETTDRQLDERR